MPIYRYYCLDGAGHILNAEWFDADSDEGAVAMIQDRHPDYCCEVWKGNQMIGATSPRQRREQQA